MKLLPLLLLLSLGRSSLERRTMRIAAIFDEGSNIQHEIAFRHAVQMVNENR